MRPDPFADLPLANPVRRKKPPWVLIGVVSGIMLLVLSVACAGVLVWLLRPRLASVMSGQNSGTGQGASPLAEVTNDEIRLFGVDLEGKKRQMHCRFASLDDEGEYVNLSVFDSKNSYSSGSVLADKSRFGRQLLDIPRRSDLLLTGTVKKINGRYVLLIDAID